MGADIVERLSRRAIVLSDTAQMKTQFPEWLVKELSEASDDATEAAAEIRKLREKAGELAIARSNDIAEIGRLRGEVEALRQCGVKYLGWLGVKDAENGLRKDMADPEMVDRPAPAMPNGVEASREQFNAWMKTRGVISSWHVQQDMWNAWTASRAADNRDAAGVDSEEDAYVIERMGKLLAEIAVIVNGPEPPMSRWSYHDLPEKVRALKDTPAAVPAGEAVAYSVVQIGNRGAAYDPPNTHRAFTYEHQPGNIDASRLGRATNAAAVASAGDSIDRGLSLLKELQAIGFGVFQIGPHAPVQAAPQEGEQDTSRWPLLDRVEFALRDAGFDYDEAFRIAHMAANPSDCELGEAAYLRWRLEEIMPLFEEARDALPAIHEVSRKMNGISSTLADRMDAAGTRTREQFAALQHRGDSQEVGRG